MRKKETQPTFSVVAHNERVIRLIRKFDARLKVAHSERLEIIEREESGERLCSADKAKCSDLYLRIADLSRTLQQLSSLILPEDSQPSLSVSDKGFKDDSCIRKNSVGDNFPVTFRCVGGTPNNDTSSYWVVQHPCGTKRRSWTAEYRDKCIATFVEANDAIKGLDLNIVSERTAFEIALDELSRKGKWIGFSIDEVQR